MSLSSALNMARSGLGVSAFQADLTARNIANAGTKEYTRKSAEQITDRTGGARIASVDRQVDELLDRLNRTNVSRLAAQQTIADGMRAYTDYLGQPADEMSPVKSMTDLNSAFIILSGAPSDSSAQLSVLASARQVASHFNDLSGTVSALSQEVEMNIRYDVADLNKALSEVASLNGRMLHAEKGSAMRAEMADEMTRALEAVSGLMDIQTVTDRNGMISVLTSGGTELVRGRTVTDITYEGATGRLRAGDIDITPGGANRAFSEGSLRGLFELRNQVIPSISGQLDTVAAALVEGFERVAPMGPAALGLFTDAGAAFDPADISGMAGRIRVNTAIDPILGGDPSLLQKGTDPMRPPGDTTVISSMLRLFSDPVAIPTGDLGGGDLLALTTSMVSSQQILRAQAQNTATATATAAATISASRENLQGVDIDNELQKLIVIEKSYAANSKVMTMVASMLDALIDAA